jgi:hypothetical protein
MATTDTAANETTLISRQDSYAELRQEHILVTLVAHIVYGALVGLIVHPEP